MSIFSDKLSNIKLLAMDVDGTLTDRGVYYTKYGELLKRFSVHDGMGITLLNQAKISSLIISSDGSSIPLKRAEKLDVTYQIIGAKRKIIHLTELSEHLNITFDEIAYIGDDVNDLEAIQLAGFSACPSDAVGIVKKTVDCVMDFGGGNGAVRQLCEMILTAQNKPITIIHK